jgi:predicted outer membrane repeat protein
LNLHGYSSKIAVGIIVGGIRSRIMRCILTAIWAMAVVTVCQARTIYVDANGTGDYPTIQAAVNDSNNGDMIILQPGTYASVGNRDIDSKGKSITVQSTDPCNPTIVAATVIDCQERGRGFVFLKGESSLLAGFTIINGAAMPFPLDEYGDAIYSKNSSPTIFNCVIKKCGYSYDYGASETIVCDYSSIKLLGCTISENGYAIDCFDSNAEITGCTISKNYRGVSFGGSPYPPYLIENTVKITDSTITDNNSAMGCSQTNLTIERSTITDNNIPSTSTGIAGIFAQYSNVVINDSIISRNSSIYYSSSTPQSDAGGVASVYGTLDINNCVISDNKAGNCGGGITNYQGSAAIRNCSITNNTAGGFCEYDHQYYAGKGGGIYSYSPTQLIVEGCAIKDNKTEGNPTNTLITSGGGIYSQGNWGTVWIKSSSIIRNKARYGGGICDYSFADVNNCLLANNEAQNGGGISNASAGSRYTNCTFVGNKAVSCAGVNGGIVTNCILWDDIFSGNAQGIELSGAEVSYSNVRWPKPDPGGSNISVDPMFVFENDGHLLPGSPCIDAGTNTPISGLSETDLDGNPRVIDGDLDGFAIVDMGAFEFDSAVSRLAISDSEFTFSCAKNGPNPEPQVLQIRNCNGGHLDWQITENCPWLNVSPQNGTSSGSPSSVTITLDANQLDIGTYQADMLITSPGAAGSPQTVHVTVQVGRLLSVPQSFNTIQNAIDGANNGDWVIVANGIYTGDGNRDIDFRGKAITVCSQNGPETCIIDCNGTPAEYHRAFIFQTSETSSSILDGFTITNGYNSDGGAIQINGTPTIKNCVFIKNTTLSRGGALFASAPSSAGTPPMPIVVQQCSFIENSANLRGGAIFSGRSLKLTDCNFIENTVSISGNPGTGGGIALENSSSTSCSALIEECNFTGNFARAGGAINAASNTAGNISIMNSTFIGNTAKDITGALNIISATFNTNMSNSVIAGNRGKTRGGIVLAGPSQITNCTIVGNSTILSDPLLGPVLGNPAVVRNCIIADYGPLTINSNPNANITFSNVLGRFPGVGNIDIDPCFVKPGYWADPNNLNVILEPNDLNAVWVNGDYHLKSEGWRWDIKRHHWTYDDVTSRCIDAGNPGSPLGDEPLSIPDDPDNEWGQNLRIDMGAYGGTPEASMPPYDWAILGDLTNDGIVDFSDFAYQAKDWQTRAEEQSGDLDRNGAVGMGDLWLLVEDWLLETSWHNN